MNTTEKSQPQSGRLPISAHTSRPWRIHEVVPDFEVEDVWALPTPGGPDDFPLLLSKLASSGPPEAGASRIGSWLWALRWKLGEWFGWDREDKDSGVALIRKRLPADLQETNLPKQSNSPFTPLYQSNNEYASAIANRTMQGVMHLSWVNDGAGGYRGQMAVLVKTNGVFGKFYMALIKPFRYLFIYPALLKRFEQVWTQRS